MRKIERSYRELAARMQSLYPIGTRFVAEGIGNCPGLSTFVIRAHHPAQETFYAMSLGFNRTYEMNPDEMEGNLTVIFRPQTLIPPA